MAVGNANVARYLTLAAAADPDSPAVKLPRRRDGELSFEAVSFRRLETCASAAALCCREHGIKRGTRVLLMVKPGFDLIVTVFALFKLGAVPVVIDPGMGWGHFRACVRQSRPEALVGIPAATWLSPLLLRGYRFRHKLTVGSARWRRMLAGAAEGKIRPSCAGETLPACPPTLLLNFLRRAREALLFSCAVFALPFRLKVLIGNSVCVLPCISALIRTQKHSLIVCASCPRFSVLVFLSLHAA